MQAPDPNPAESPDAGANIYNKLDAVTTAAIANSPGSRPVPILNDQSKGVLGIEGLQLNSDSVFTTGGKGVKLKGGTRLLLGVSLM